MKAITKLTAAALGAMSIAGGVAIAQDTSSNATDARQDTANYGTPPGAPLKRDGSLRADPAPAAATSAMTDSSSGTAMASTPSTDAPAAADTSTNTADASLQPRADRN